VSQHLTTASVLVCPHGGSVVGVASQQDQLEDGYPLLSSADVFVVAGCPLTDADGRPSPCLQVEWSTTAELAVGWGHALDATSVGTCLDSTAAPQGLAVVVSV
jgi:hypothetical protein